MAGGDATGDAQRVPLAKIGFCLTKTHLAFVGNPLVFCISTCSNNLKTTKIMLVAVVELVGMWASLWGLSIISTACLMKLTIRLAAYSVKGKSRASDSPKRMARHLPSTIVAHPEWGEASDDGSGKKADDRQTFRHF
jgi:hypothetical protein